MPILSTDKYASGTLFAMTAADPFAFLKRDVVYYSTGGGPAMTIDATIGTGASLSLAGWVEAARTDQTAIAVTGVTTQALTRSITIGDTGTVASHGAGIVSTNASLTLINEGSILTQGNALKLTAPATGDVFFRSVIVNHGTISASNADAISISGGAVDLTNTGVIQGSIRVTGGARFDLVNTGTIIGFLSLGGGAGGTIDTHEGTLNGRIFGSQGDDTYVIAGTERIGEVDEGGFDQVFSFGDYRLPDQIENLFLRGNAHVGGGNQLDNLIYGNEVSGDVRLSGGAGDDQLLGGNGDDVLIGQAGDDILFLSFGADTLSGGAGIDQMFVGARLGALRIDLAAGIVDGVGVEGTTIVGVENVGGSSADDVIVGSSVANRLSGGDGNDSISGGAGNDVIDGGRGDDLIDGQGNTDTVDFSHAVFDEPPTSALTIDLAAGTASGAQTGQDRLVLIENVVAGAGGDTITGSTVGNRLDGAAGDDVIGAGDGNDTLVGGVGADTLTSGTGRDTFLFAADVAGGSGSDIVVDFENGRDKISFTGGLLNVTSFGELSFSDPGDGSVIVTSAEGAIKLIGMTIALLDASDFVFDPAPPAAPAVTGF